ncbi:MAG: type VI secretion system baseplate subunit TssK [Deltaproteobacteria bacterium]|nr:type VI secretion system baseplate subunit TssK [Deltaproteobacteria bacterium]
MSETTLCDVVWSEGMFLTPHHMQHQSAHEQDLRWVMTRHLASHPWGYQRLKINQEALADHRLQVLEARLLLPSGFYLELPGNLELGSASFKELMAGGASSLMVYLGLPDLRPGQPNLDSALGAAAGVGSPRFTAAPFNLVDTNSGQLPREIEIMRAKGKLFFGDQEKTGYESVPLARLVRAASGEGAALDETWFPPLLSLAAWEPMRLLAQEIVGRLVATQNALTQNISGREISEILSLPRGLETALKVLALAGPAQAVIQLAQAARVHPFVFYTELARLVEGLRLFAGAMSLGDLPPYHHEAPGEAFLTLRDMLGRLLDRLAAPAYIRRPFIIRHDRLEVDLDPDWVSGQHQLFLGVVGDDDPDTLVRKMAVAKLCAPRDLEIVVQRRVGGLPVNWLRLPPPSLPAKSDGMYGQLAPGGSMWSGVQDDLTLTLSGVESLGYRFDLFVV